jgi:uncharacterized protein (UPF0332 family)
LKQPNDIGTRKDLAMHRIDNAKSDIKSAEILLDAGEYRSSNNRAYYGIYHAIAAIHALDGNAHRKLFILQLNLKRRNRLLRQRSCWN